MKHFIRFSCIVVLMLLLNAGIAQGAVHHNGSDYFDAVLMGFDFGIPKMDTWYTIDKEQQQFQGGIFDLRDYNTASLQWYWNDHTFVALEYADFFLYEGPLELKSLRASYLWDFGLFTGLFVGNDSADTVILFSPGYRFSLGDDGYIAISLDYLSGDDYDEIVGYDLDFKHYFTKGKLWGHLYYEDNIDQTLIQLGGNFKVADNLVVGFKAMDMEFMDYSRYSAGFTWTPQRFVVDGTVGHFGFKDEDYTFYSVSGMFAVTDKLSLGAQYEKHPSILGNPLFTLRGNQYSFKIKYATDDYSVGLIYSFENDSTPDSFWLTCTVNL